MSVQYTLLAFEHESPPMTTRPGLPPIVMLCLNLFDINSRFRAQHVAANIVVLFYPHLIHNSLNSNVVFIDWTSSINLFAIAIHIW